jgi:hypothetical protein
MAKSKTTKILLGVGGGCLGLIACCCLTGVGLVYYRTSSLESAATDHVEQFLGHVQARDWNAAFVDSEYDIDYATSTSARHQQCVEDTALGDITAYDCDSASLESLVEDDVDVTCTVTSATRGQSEVTIRVNAADSSPYLGFYWFSSPSQFGDRWRTECSTWSGREYYRDPPAGRVRPM